MLSWISGKAKYFSPKDIIESKSCSNSKFFIFSSYIIWEVFLNSSKFLSNFSKLLNKSMFLFNSIFLSSLISSSTFCTFGSPGIGFGIYLIISLGSGCTISFCLLSYSFFFASSCFILFVKNLICSSNSNIFNFCSSFSPPLIISLLF